MKVIPVVDFLSSILANPASTYLTICCRSVDLQYVIPYDRVPAKYLSTLFNIIWCCMLGLAIYDVRWCIMNVISGLVQLAIYCNSPSNHVYELLQLDTD